MPPHAPSQHGCPYPPHVTHVVSAPHARSPAQVRPHIPTPLGQGISQQIWPGPPHWQIGQGRRNSGRPRGGSIEGAEAGVEVLEVRDGAGLGDELLVEDAAEGDHGEAGVLDLPELHRGEVVTRTQLYEHLFDENDTTMSNLLDVHVSNVRKKLGAEFIVTRRGHGYCIE